MGIEQEFKKVKLFAGIIYPHPDIYLKAKNEFEKIFSPVDLETVQMDFTFTDYYNPEMGSTLYKRFMTFEKLIPPEDLPDIKILTNKMEQESAIDGNRTVNIDPGYLSDANVILATTKNHYHRIPLAKGIYAHMEYVIKKKNTLTPLEWTYPDFKSRPYMEFFEKIIPIFKQSLKKQTYCPKD